MQKSVQLPGRATNETQTGIPATEHKFLLMSFPNKPAAANGAVPTALPQSAPIGAATEECLKANNKGMRSDTYSR